MQPNMPPGFPQMPGQMPPGYAEQQQQQQQLLQQLQQQQLLQLQQQQHHQMQQQMQQQQQMPGVTLMLVNVPPNVRVGEQMVVMTPTGQQYMVVVPQGAGPGSQFQIAVPNQSIAVQNQAPAPAQMQMMQQQQYMMPPRQQQQQFVDPRMMKWHDPRMMGAGPPGMPPSMGGMQYGADPTRGGGRGGRGRGRKRRGERDPMRAPRAPSAYNLFMKTEVARIKVVQPELSHKDAFREAARNWGNAEQNPASKLFKGPSGAAGAAGAAGATGVGAAGEDEEAGEAGAEDFGLGEEDEGEEDEAGARHGAEPKSELAADEEGDSAGAKRVKLESAITDAAAASIMPSVMPATTNGVDAAVVTDADASLVGVDVAAAAPPMPEVAPLAPDGVEEEEDDDDDEEEEEEEEEA
jgi:hypothetical protein